MATVDPGRRVAWPSIVFDAPVFRGLDIRAHREIEAAGTLRRLASGERLYSAGQSGDAFYIVASGAVSLAAIRRGDDEPTLLRRAMPSESFGEEAVVSTERRADATAEEPSLVAEIPVHLFRRAVVRSGKADLADRLERAMRRAATRDLLRTVAIARDLDDATFDMLLDAVGYRSFDRGQAIYRVGEPADALWLVVGGRVQIQTEDDARVRVRAYLGRGDFFGDEDLEAGAPRASAAVASGRVTLLSVPRTVALEIAKRTPGLFARLRRLSQGERARQHGIVAAAAQNATQHVFRDLYRLEVARSLLVIDLETCVRCGHCTWACGELHGTPRLVRRGDKIVTRSDPSPARLAPADGSFDVFALGQSSEHLMLPNSCQHCENPACMVDCPTGAIGKDPDGEVFIREELCTGCGACARACPWSNIQIAERPKNTPRPLAATADDIAVKCDLCRNFESGPACVQACPTGAIFRIDPSEDLSELRGLFGRAKVSSVAEPSRVERVAPPLVGSTIAALALGIVGAVMQQRGRFAPSHGLGYAAGVGAAVCFVLLLAYAAPKRGVRLWMRRAKTALTRKKDVRAEATVKASRRSTRSITAPQLVVHLGLGVVSLGLAIAHSPYPPRIRSTSGSALYLAFVAAGVLGILTALAYAIVPRRLARVERTALLPEDFVGEKQALSDRLFRGVTGKSEVVKKLVERVLMPYVASVLGPTFLLVSGRDLRAERERLKAQIDRLLDGRGRDRLGGIDDLVRVVVELRALEAQRFLIRLLRVGLPLHVAAFSIASVLLLLHLFAGVGR